MSLVPPKNQETLKFRPQVEAFTEVKDKSRQEAKKFTGRAVGIEVDGTLLSCIYDLEIKDGKIVGGNMVNPPDTTQMSAATAHRLIWEYLGPKDRG